MDKSKISSIKRVNKALIRPVFYFVDFKKWCYKDKTLGSQRNINGASRMVPAYEFLDLVYKKTVCGSRGSVFNDADKNTYSLRVKFI